MHCYRQFTSCRARHIFGDTVHGTVGDNPADLRLGGFHTAGYNAATAEGLYQCLAAIYCYGAIGRRHGGGFIIGKTADRSTIYKSVAADRYAVDLAFYVRDNRLRCYQRIPFAGRLRNKLKTGLQRNRLSVCRVRLHAARRILGDAGSGLCRSRYRNGSETRQRNNFDRPGRLAASIQHMDRSQGIVRQNSAGSYRCGQYDGQTRDT